MRKRGKGGVLPWNLVRTTSRGWRAATVANPATAPAAAFSHFQLWTSNAGIDTGERGGGIGNRS